VAQGDTPIILFAYFYPPSKIKAWRTQHAQTEICRKTIPERQSRLPFVTFAFFCSNSLCFLLSVVKSSWGEPILATCIADKSPEFVSVPV
jgi:hypothetical protein